jgi:hypothetical protein
MFDRISRSWAMAGQCWKVLKEDPALLVFPLMSTAALLLLLASFAAPVWVVHHRLDPVDAVYSTTHTARLMYYVMLGVFYVINYSVMMFFNTALIAVALRRLDGEDATVREGLQLAWDNVGSILAYALIAASIGAIVRVIEERVGFIGRIVVGIIGAAWTVASSMTLPILVVESVGPIEAISRSLDLMKRSWGENIVGNGGISLGVAVIAVPCDYSGRDFDGGGRDRTGFGQHHAAFDLHRGAVSLCHRCQGEGGNRRNVAGGCVQGQVRRPSVQGFHRTSTKSP